MYALFLPLVVLLGLAHAAALPVPAAHDTIVQLTTCTEPSLGGTCRTWEVIAQEQCIGFADTDWNDVISSVSVPAGYRCRLWSSNHCDGDSTPDIFSPGADALPNNMNNKATSFKCYVN